MAEQPEPPCGEGELGRRTGISHSLERGGTSCGEVARRFGICAAHGIGMGVRLPCGNDINSSNANYNQSGIGQTRDVGQYAANPWGFYDMHGNVNEWTADWYAASYPTGSVTDPVGPTTGSTRVRRGGSWTNAASLRPFRASGRERARQQLHLPGLPPQSPTGQPVAEPERRRFLPPLSLREGAKPRRGNPAEPWGNPRIAPASRITPQTGLPRQFSSRPSSQ
jgi:hypothetical protein